MERFEEKCGIIGVFGDNSETARLAYFGLWALQHRGQESSGISSSNGKKITSHKGEGLVAHVYQEEDLKKLAGHIAIGQNRYGTSGGSDPCHAQPVTSPKGLLALSHNGNLPSTKKLLEFLKSKKIPTADLNDSELMHRSLEYYLLQGKSIEEAVKKCYPLFTGVFCLTLLTKNKLVALRDTYGIRPLCMGKLNGDIIFASETCALDTIQATFVREVKPGEMIVVDTKGVHSYQLTKSQQKLDIFEFIYFARPDSNMLGKSVNEVRKNLGVHLGKECYIPADLVIPVPDSAIPAAIGYAQETGIPFEHALIKNRYIHRTFIRPEQHLRERDVGIKLNPLKLIIKGKKIVIIDDSIVRGTTSKKIVTLLRQAGAKEVHLLLSCPPVKFPDFYGINTPSQQELIASHKNLEEITEYIGADSVYFLSYNGMIEATGIPESKFSLSEFNGDYPCDIGERKNEIAYPKEKVKQLAILISNAGTGTNLQAIIDVIEAGKLNAKIAVVISDKEDAYGLVRAKKHNIPTHIFDSKKEKLENLLTKKYPVDYIVLTGWKKIIPNTLIELFPEKILNIHPGLIPEGLTDVVKNPDNTDGLWNRGKFTDQALQNFLDTKATFAGSTVHFLSKEFDFGKVLGRCWEKIKSTDTVESLYQRLKQKENALYTTTLITLCKSDAPAAKINNPVVVVDSGGRGSALVAKYSQSPHVGKVIAIPGNDLMRQYSTKPVETYPHLTTSDVEKIIKICKDNHVALVDVAQENAVAAKLVDLLHAEGIPVLGPTWLAGQLEWSKAYSRICLQRQGINQPFFRICHSKEEGINFIQNNPDQAWFVKADGLCEGKVALPARNNAEAIERIRQLDQFGEAGKIFLIEKWLGGKDGNAEELSVLVLTDGNDFRIIGTAQDHKRVNNFDEGENTGSMGTSSSPLVATPKVMAEVTDVIKKTFIALREEGIVYKGMLYLSAMLLKENEKLIPYVIEYNCRWGDPEAQVLLPGLKNDLFELSMAIINGELEKIKILLDGKVRVAVTGAARGYPTDYTLAKGKKIIGIEDARKLPNVHILSAGIKKVGKDHVVHGGRLFYAVGEGKDILEARKNAYNAISLISVEGNNLHYRTDIGWRDVERIRIYE